MSAAPEPRRTHRILFWTGSFWPVIGGADVMAARLATALHRRGHQVLVITERSDHSLPSLARYGGIPVHRFEFWEALHSRDPERFVELRGQIARLKRQFQPEVVHQTLLSPAIVFHLETARSWPAGFLVTVQQAEIESFGTGATSVLGRNLRAADWIAHCSRATQQAIESAIPDLANPGSVIPNALDPPATLPVPLPTEPRVLCLGRLVSDKGFDIALRAFVAVAERRPGARMIIAGDGTARGELEELARTLGIRERVEFAGWIAPSDVPALINRASLLLLPSRREAFGLVVLEAMLMARPVIATDVGGLPEVVAHRRTGLLVPRDDVDATVQALDWMLEHRGEAVAMGQEGRKVALDSFGWARHLESYEQLYDRLSARGKMRD